MCLTNPVSHHHTRQISQGRAVTRINPVSGDWLPTSWLPTATELPAKLSKLCLCRPALGGSTPASFSQRLVAILIDGLLLAVPFAIAITSGIVLIVSSFTNVVEDANHTVVSADVNGGTLALGVIIVILSTFAIYLPYYLILVGKGATVGDKVAGIRIINANGNPPVYSKAFIRLLVQIFLSGNFLIGYLWMLWDPEKQTLHDKLAGTFSISTKSSLIQKNEPESTRN